MPKARRTRDRRLVPKIATQVVRECRDRCVAIVRVLAERFDQDRAEVRVDTERTRIRRRVGAQRANEITEVLRSLSVGRLPAHELERDHRERVEIGAHLDLAGSREMFGTHVSPRPGDPLERPLVAIDHPRDAEVDDPRHPGRIDEDVRRLQVAVDHASLMRVVYGVRDIGEHSNAVTTIHLASPRMRVERRRSLDELHRDQRGRLRERIDFDDARLVELGDARMAESRERVRLVVNAAPHRLVCGIDGYDLDRRLATWKALAGPVHGAHATLADSFDELVSLERARQLEVQRARRDSAIQVGLCEIPQIDERRLGEKRGVRLERPKRPLQAFGHLWILVAKSVEQPRPSVIAEIERLAHERVESAFVVGHGSPPPGRFAPSR